MTVTSTDTSAEVVVHALRTRVRDRLELEYLRLRTVDRLAALKLVSIGAQDATEARRELANLDERISAVHRYLGTAHDPHPDAGACLGCGVLLDTGEGEPRWFLIASLPVEDEQVIAADSSLGRALRCARPGESVRYVSSAGPRIARILDVGP